jgi:hypothetical protein
MQSKMTKKRPDKKVIAVSGAFIAGLLPLAVFIVNMRAVDDLALVDAAAGGTLIYTAVTLALFTASYLAYRMIYTPKQQKKYVRVSLISLVVSLLFAGIYTLGVIGVFQHLSLTDPSTDTAAFLSLGLLLVFGQFILIDLKLYDTRTNTHLTDAMNAAKTSTKNSLYFITITSLVLAFAFTLVIPETTPRLLLFAITLLWGGVYSTMIYPAILDIAVRLFPKKL